MFDPAGIGCEAASYQEMTSVIMYHRPKSPATTNKNIPTFSQKWLSLKALFFLISPGKPPVGVLPLYAILRRNGSPFRARVRDGLRSAL